MNSGGGRSIERVRQSYGCFWMRRESSKAVRKISDIDESGGDEGMTAQSLELWSFVIRCPPRSTVDGRRSLVVGCWFLPWSAVLRSFGPSCRDSGSRLLFEKRFRSSCQDRLSSAPPAPILQPMERAYSARVGDTKIRLLLKHQFNENVSPFITFNCRGSNIGHHRSSRGTSVK